MGFLKGFYGALLSVGQLIQDFFLLAIRLYWGWGFFKIGLSKLEDIKGAAEFFTKLGIPYADFSAHFVGGVECVCGGMLFLGLGSRLISIPLIIVTITAYFTAHFDAIKGFLSHPQMIVSQAPFYFLITVLTVFVFGPGRISIDGFLDRAYFKSGRV